MIASGCTEEKTIKSGENGRDTSIYSRASLPDILGISTLPARMPFQSTKTRSTTTQMQKRRQLKTIESQPTYRLTT